VLSTKYPSGYGAQKKILELVEEVRETAYDLYKYLGYGHLEKVYENGLANRLSRKGYDVRKQYPLKVWDEDNSILGEYFVDLFIEGCLIIELKVCNAFAKAHVRQILGYLRACKMQHGLLINFGSLKFEIKKVIL
jgi:GxxExxY protein